VFLYFVGIGRKHEKHEKEINNELMDQKREEKEEAR